MAMVQRMRRWQRGPGPRKDSGATGGGQPQPVQATNFMLDLGIPGHFPTQAFARRFLHNIMFLESNPACAGAQSKRDII